MNKKLRTLFAFSLIFFVSLSAMETDTNDLKNQLATAIANGNTDTVKEILAHHNLDLEVKDPLFGRTFLIRAARSGYTAMVKELLDRGANYNTVTDEGQTAYDLALYPSVNKIIEAHVETKIKATEEGSFSQLPQEIIKKIKQMIILRKK